MGRKRVVWEFRWQDEPKEGWLLVDNDWGGSKDRKSTSGGVWMLGGHCIKTWSVNQQVMSMSSGEAEYYGLVRGAAHGIGIRNIMEDLGIARRIRIKTELK